MRFVSLHASRALTDGPVLEHVVDGGEEESSDGADSLLLAAPGADAVRTPALPFRSMRTCCATPAATLWRMLATTHGAFTGIDQSSTRRATRN